ncbi:hypothetical protein KEM55_002986, partial [Ascosphaera atra]
MKKFKSFNPDEYVYSHNWSVGGEFDWKTFVDYHYNEYCHANVDKSSRKIKKHGDDRDWSRNMIVDFDRETFITPTYIFPTTMVMFNRMHMCLVRCEPIGPGRSNMHYEVYRHVKCPTASFLDMEEFLKEVVREDLTLCRMRQHTLNKRHYKPGEKWDNGSGAGGWLRLIKMILDQHRMAESK